MDRSGLERVKCMLFFFKDLGMKICKFRGKVCENL